MKPPTARPPLLREPKRRRLPSRAGTTTTSIALPQPLHQEAMLAALQRNWTFAEVLRAALGEWLTRHAADAARGRRGKGGRR